MSGRYTRTQTSFYTDPDLRPWHPLTMYAYRYLYENDHAHGLTGVGRIGEDVILFETKLQPEEWRRAREEMGAKVRWFEDGSYWVVGRAKHTCFRSDGKPSPKQAAGARSFVQGLPLPVQQAFGSRYPEIMNGDAPPIPHRSGIDTVSKGHPVEKFLTDNSDSDSDHDSDSDVKSPPLPPQNRGEKNGGEMGAGENGSENGSEVHSLEDCATNGEWDEDSWNFVVRCAPKEWRKALRRKRSKLYGHAKGPAWLAAHVIDVARGRDKPDSVGEAVGRIVWRVGHTAPSDKHYNEAKKFWRRRFGGET